MPPKYLWESLNKPRRNMGLIGEKTKFQFTISSTLTDVPFVTDISPAELSYEPVETHAMGDTYLSTRASTMADVGEFSVTVMWTADNAVHEALAAAIGAQTDTACALVFSNGDKDTFNAYITSAQWANTSNSAAQLHRTFKFKVNSIPVHVEAT